MKTLSILILVLAASWLPVAPTFAPCGNQERQISSVVGTVIEIDKTNRSATVKTDQGVTSLVRAVDSTTILRVPAGAQNLDQATPISFQEISLNDRLSARGNQGESGIELNALRIVVLTKADISKRREHDLEEWRQRGVAGIVKSVNLPTSSIDLELRGAAPGTIVTIDASHSKLRRYTSEGVTFEDARSSTLMELYPGDQLRALGDKSPDGKTLKAEAIVSGSFKTIGATITGIDSQTGELKGTTLDQKTPIAIGTLKESLIHRIPASLVPAIAQKAKQPLQQNGAKAPAAEIQQLIDSLPQIGVADLKVGDVVSITGVKEKNESRITALKLVAGVDAVLKAMTTPGRPQVVRLSAGLPNAFDFSVIP